MRETRKRKTPVGRRRAVIFDRDGVLNVDHGYVGDAERFEWTPGARRAIRRLNEAGVLALVATNQSGVARGLFSEADVDRLHEAMQADLAVEGARIDGFYVCPFHADAVVAAYAHPDHPDRKPNPGLVSKALRDWAVDPTGAILIGDKPSDLEAARRAGVPGLLFQGGDLDDFVQASGVLAK
ncbi:MAG: HAD family hydrolase [Caulobacteraceae bacterium]|nr:HAD family hydrolase [Caulobacteraceae bacterium]